MRKAASNVLCDNEWWPKSFRECSYCKGGAVKAWVPIMILLSAANTPNEFSTMNYVISSVSNIINIIRVLMHTANVRITKSLHFEGASWRDDSRKCTNMLYNYLKYVTIDVPWANFRTQA